MFRALIDGYYRKSRGLSQGLDSRVPTRDLLEIVGLRAGQRLRAVARRLPSGFVGRGVRIHHRHKISMGKKVMLGDFVVVNGLSVNGVALGDAVTVDSFAQIRGSGVARHLGEGVTIGNRTAVGMYNVIWGQGGVRIGNDCLLGPQVTIVSENHVTTNAHKPIREQGESRSEVAIGNDVWIGAGATILAGSTIGDGAVVAAGAVVRGVVEPLTIVGGVPARIIGTR